LDSAALRERLKQLPAKVAEKAVPALRSVAELTLSASQADCPKLTGELAASGVVEPVPGGFAVVFKAPHALIVHERTDLAHTTGRAKFLETNYLEQLPQLPTKLLQAAEDAIAELR